MLGAIADDVTGAVDLAGNLVSRGFRTQLHFGVPRNPLPRVDAIVIALKTRTAPVRDAIDQSEDALDALLAAGCDQIYVKYCSTFDSTPQGNIGPICDLVVRRMTAPTVVVVPSFPENGRTVYQGHLFVHDVPLHESALSQHPLTPMTDSDIRRVLRAQTDGEVGHIPLSVVHRGPNAVRLALSELTAREVRYAVVDATSDSDLTCIAKSTFDAPVITGGSGLALGLEGPSTHASVDAPAETLRGLRVVLVGSASSTTRQQLRAAELSGTPVFRLALDDVERSITHALDWAEGWEDDQIIAIAPEEVSVVDATSPTGAARAARLEQAFAALATALVARGIRRLIVAGGETSGAVVAALGVTTLALGRSIGPGLAWTFAEVGAPNDTFSLALALKSGNFGREDFFIEAWKTLT